MNYRNLFSFFFLSAMNYFLEDNTIECKGNNMFARIWSNIYIIKNLKLLSLQMYRDHRIRLVSLKYLQWNILNAWIISDLFIPFTFKLNFYRDKRRWVRSRWIIPRGLDQSNRPSLRYFWLWRGVKDGELKRKKKAGRGRRRRREGGRMRGKREMGQVWLVLSYIITA